MTYQPSKNDRDKDSLIEYPALSGETARRVTVVNDVSDPIPVSVSSLSVTITGDAITSGTTDGTPTGTERTFVNNRKNQLLASHDLVVSYTWLDFGTKDERVSSIVYTSVTFTGVTVTRTFSYSLVGTKFQLDQETWVTAPGG